jgi:hypothetical protein
MVDFPDSVAFRVSTADLNDAIEILRALGRLVELPSPIRLSSSSEADENCSRRRRRSGSLARPSRVATCRPAAVDGSAVLRAGARSPIPSLGRSRDFG